MLGCFTLTDAEAGTADRLLVSLAAQLAAEGLRVNGAVQVNTDTGADCACEMDLVVLGDNRPAIRISQSLGTGSAGCRLDTGALQVAAGRVATRLADGADLCILPKFGRQEAIGLGFRDVIAEALQAGVPVLVHVPTQQRQAFDDFAGGYAEWLDPQTLLGWCREAAKGRAA